MENASKALIIAGAILLSIAIIGVGMAVFSNVSETITGADMTQQETDAYNQEFLSYEGNVRGSIAKTLCNRINSHNLGAEDDSRKIKLSFGSGGVPDDCPPPEEGDETTTTAYINNIKNTNIQSGKTYTVTLGYDSDSGLITQIDISDAE